MKPVGFACSIIICTLMLSSCGSIAVMSFNVRQSHAGDSGDRAWDSRKEACLQMLESQKPDLVGFQEAWCKGQFSFFKSRLADSGYDGYGLGRDDGKEKGESTGFLYNKNVLELLDCGTFWQSDTPGVPSVCYNDRYKCPRSVSWGFFRVRKNGRRFLYLNTHSPVDGYSQLKGFEVIFQWLKTNNPDGLPVILTGDFNVTSSGGVLNPLNSFMNDARELAPVTDCVKTYNAWGNEGKSGIIDFIYLSSGIKCSEYHADTNRYGGLEYISDHYPIKAVVKI